MFRLVNPVIIGDVFYAKLFYEFPQLKALFHSPGEIQSKKMIDMLNIIVGRLDNFTALDNQIKQLAVRHVQYGVQPNHYEAVGKALLWTLEQGLGIDWTEEIKLAWQNGYSDLAKAMRQAAYG